MSGIAAITRTCFNERTLPLAKEQMLQGGDGQKIIFGKHNKP
jgi:hypothetical protein